MLSKLALSALVVASLVGMTSVAPAQTQPAPGASSEGNVGPGATNTRMKHHRMKTSMNSHRMKTGKVTWQKDNTLEPSGITFADGHFYCYGQMTGTVACVAATPTGFSEAGRFTIPKQTTHRKPAGGIWTHPVIADGKIYLRDQELLYCFDLRDGRASGE